MPDPSPLIVTLAFAEPDQASFERERRTHFPAALNHIPAHLSLFHHLPGEAVAAVSARLAAAAAATPAFALTITEPMLLGRGVAWRLHAPALTALRAELAAAWQAWLTPQDRQAFRPHVTIQNKVAPDQARALFDQMRNGFEPRTVQAAAMQLWWYRGGPWDEAGRFALTATVT